MIITKFLRKPFWVLIAALGLGLALFLRHSRGLDQSGSTRVEATYGAILIPEQSRFGNGAEKHQAAAWVAARWGTSDNDVYMIVQGSEPWMRIIGLLDPKSLSSALLWVLDTNSDEGQHREAELLARGIPHQDNIFLITEYKPETTAERAVAVQFYSTRTIDGLAIIEDVRWTGRGAGSGTIIAYQSEKLLPSISVPVEGGVLRKDKAHQSQVGN